MNMNEVNKKNFLFFSLNSYFNIQAHQFTKIANDPLRTIYKEIIQPLIGDFFEVDAAVPITDLNPKNEVVDENGDESFCCCGGPRDYQSASVSEQGDSMRSEGKFYIYVKKKLYIYRSNLIIIFIFLSVNRNSK